MAHSVWRSGTDHNTEQHRLGHSRSISGTIRLLVLVRHYIRDMSKLELQQGVLKMRDRIWQLLRAGVLA